MTTDSPSPELPTSHRSIIDRWPSLGVFAADIGVSYGRAKAWRRRDSIPLEHVSAVVGAARRRGLQHVSAELIADLAAEKGAGGQIFGDGQLHTAPAAQRLPSIERAKS